ncbi:DUF6207 family protein [Streptomyces sp. NPDC059832]|uniref:DUF6207 family protein n=1 Tax=Streptomyces sp. NPDC059832 TaxID=3346966 RepID=UPI003660F834
MEPIHAQHLSEPELVVLDITAADEATAHEMRAPSTGESQREPSRKVSQNRST